MSSPALLFFSSSMNHRYEYDLDDSFRRTNHELNREKKDVFVILKTTLRANILSSSSHSTVDITVKTKMKHFFSHSQFLLLCKPERKEKIG